MIKLGFWFFPPSGRRNNGEKFCETSFLSKTAFVSKTCLIRPPRWLLGGGPATGASIGAQLVQACKAGRDASSRQFVLVTCAQLARLSPKRETRQKTLPGSLVAYMLHKRTGDPLISPGDRARQWAGGISSELCASRPVSRNIRNRRSNVYFRRTAPGSLIKSKLAMVYAPICFGAIFY